MWINKIVLNFRCADVIKLHTKKLLAIKLNWSSSSSIFMALLPKMRHAYEIWFSPSTTTISKHDFHNNGIKWKTNRRKKLVFKIRYYQLGWLAVLKWINLLVYGHIYLRQKRKHLKQKLVVQERREKDKEEKKTKHKTVDCSQDISFVIGW